MFVEAKSHGAILTASQRDTLYLFDQILRNRKITPTKSKIPQQSGSMPGRVYSLRNNKWIDLRAYGGHWLQMSGDDPENSHWMKWDKKPIDYQRLIQVLRFDLDPDTLRPVEWRRHHKPNEDTTLFDGNAA
jgi:hypothetical protein